MKPVLGQHTIHKKIGKAWVVTTLDASSPFYCLNSLEADLWEHFFVNHNQTISFQRLNRKYGLDKEYLTENINQFFKFVIDAKLAFR